MHRYNIKLNVDKLNQYIKLNINKIKQKINFYISL